MTQPVRVQKEDVCSEHDL